MSRATFVVWSKMRFCSPAAFFTPLKVSSMFWPAAMTSSSTPALVDRASDRRSTSLAVTFATPPVALMTAAVCRPTLAASRASPMAPFKNPPTWTAANAPPISPAVLVTVPENRLVIDSASLNPCRYFFGSAIRSQRTALAIGPSHHVSPHLKLLERHGVIFGAAQPVVLAEDGAVACPPGFFDEPGSPFFAPPAGGAAVVGGPAGPSFHSPR